MRRAAPQIDPRTVHELARQLGAAVSGYAGWRPAPGADDPGEALIRIVAHYGEVVVERLNQVPEKSFEAFLALLGLEPLPPQPARVPLTFSLAAGSPTDAIVPAGTPVEAQPAPDDTDPIVFETERELVVTRTQLLHALTLDPARGLYRDSTTAAIEGSDAGFPVFEGDPSTPVEHALYLGSSAVLGASGGKDVVVRLSPADANNRWPESVTWAYRDADLRWLELSSRVRAAPVNGAWEIALVNVPAIPSTKLAGENSAWLRARWATPLVSGTSLPTIAAVALRASLAAPAGSLPPERALANGVPVDLTRDFYPFGEQPRFNDTFYFGNEEVLSRPGARVTIDVHLTNPSTQNISPPPAQPSPDLALRWEFWNASVSTWQPLGETGAAPAAAPDPAGPYGFQDKSRAFTVESAVTFTCPDAIGPVEVNGQTGHWLRVRIVRGSYGHDAMYEEVDLPTGAGATAPPMKGWVLRSPAAYGPPSIQSLALTWAATPDAPVAPDLILTENDFALMDRTSETTDGGGAGFSPYALTPNAAAGLYLGFALPTPGLDVAFDNRPTMLYVSTPDPQPGGAPDLSSGTEPPVLVWTYWNGSTWSSLPVLDDTRGFTQRGLVSFIGPADFRASNQFGRDAFWLRVSPEQPLAVGPRLRRILTNTVWAVHAATQENETLGPSNGEPGQVFRASRVLVLPGQRLDVREPREPAADQRRTIEADEGPDAIRPADESEPPGEVWVRWHAVADLYESGPDSRHYTLNRLTGEVRFGDGRQGMIPPRGVANVRLASYQSGGGPAGNRPVGSVTQLKRAIPYLDGVSNHESATGGSAAEDVESLKVRGPRVLRHRDRAVTTADFEDLALEASPQVARARAIPADAGQHGGDGLDVDTAAQAIGMTPDQLRRALRAKSLAELAAARDIDPTAVAQALNAAASAEIEQEVSAGRISADQAARLSQGLDDQIQQQLTRRWAGHVRLIVVPHGTEARPTPGPELLDRVRRYLGERVSPTVDLEVTEPDWLPVSVSGQIVPRSMVGASAVLEAVGAWLAAFLHPLTGGATGQGWEFGREPRVADFFAHLERLPGVDHVAELEARLGYGSNLLSARSDHFLVYSGQHHITLSGGTSRGPGDAP
jgi:hypothetical protein